MLALKLTLVPLFLLVVSMWGKWWGPSIAGWLAGLPVVAGPIFVPLDAFPWACLRSPRGELIAGGNPSVRGVQFRLCVDVPIVQLANRVNCRPRRLVPVRLRALALADLAFVGPDRCSHSSLLWAVVLAEDFGRYGRRASFLVRSARQNDRRGPSDLVCHIGVGLGRPNVERVACGLPAARDHPFRFIPSRARSGFRDFAIARYGAGAFLIRRVLSCSDVRASLPTTHRAPLNNHDD